MSYSAPDVQQFVVCRLGDVACGIPIDAVVEIMGVPALSRPGRATRGIAGMFDFRGHVVAVVDGRVALGLPPVPTTGRARVIVLSHREGQLGLLVDAVAEVVSLTDAERQATGDGAVFSSLVTAVAHLDDGLMLELEWDSLLEAVLAGEPHAAPGVPRVSPSKVDAA